VNVAREGRTIVLSVRDEGIGLPPEIDETTSTGLGMRLVSAFAKQLNGSVEVKRHAPGTEFVVSFGVEP
jgi:two-component sensor histidine kinase